MLKFGLIKCFIHESIHFKEKSAISKDEWDDDFIVNDALLVAKTAIGEATLKILQLNHPNRIIERAALIASGLYPPPDYPILK